MKNALKLAVLFMLVSISALAFQKRIGTATGTTAQTVIYGTRDVICVYCTTGSVRYEIGTSTTLVTATTSSPAIDFPGDCYIIDGLRGTDRISLIHKDGSSTFTCEVNAVLK